MFAASIKAWIALQSLQGHIPPILCQHNFYVYSLDTATQLGSVDDDKDLLSPKPPTKSVSWASSLPSSSISSEDYDQQEILSLRHDLKEAMKDNLE